MDFGTPEEEEKFVIELVSSRFWRYMQNIIEGRIETIISLMEKPGINGSTRHVMSGRLVELQSMKKIPLNSAHYFQKLREQRQEENKAPATLEDVMEKLKTDLNLA